MRTATVLLICCLMSSQNLLAKDDAPSAQTPKDHPAASSPASDLPGETAVSFRRDLIPLFRDNCAICHQDELPYASLSVEPESAYQMLVGAPATEADMERVAPGNPDRSYLLLKISGRNKFVKGGGVGMPLGALPLSAAEVDLVRRWIQQGAPNN